MMRGIPGQTQLAVGSLIGLPLRAASRAALYRAVYSGLSGGGFGARGFLSCLGSVKWIQLTFSHIPLQSGSLASRAYAVSAKQVAAFPRHTRANTMVGTRV